MCFTAKTPESQGLSSKHIINFITELEREGITMRSLLMLRNNSLIFEGYYTPYTKTTLQRMFSVTKSFVSAAIGVLYSKGKIDLDAPVISYFPEYLTENTHPYTKSVTVRQLLKMKSQFEKTAFNTETDTNYVKAFFTCLPQKAPDTTFAYDTSAAHILCALVEKLTNKPLLGFLRDEFLREAGFSEEAYILKDPMGVSLGGSGLMALPMDILILADIFLKVGKSGDKQVIPQGYINEAVKKQADNSKKGGFREEKTGYGYQIWILPKGGYMFYGLGGQLALIFPEKQFITVTTADTIGEKNKLQKIFELFWKHIYDNIQNMPLKEDKKAQTQLNALKESLEIKPLPIGLTPPKTPRLLSHGAEENPFGIYKITLSLCEKSGVLIFLTEEKEEPLPFGFGCLKEGKLPFTHYKCFSSASLEKHRLTIKTHVTDEEISQITITLSLDTLTLSAKASLPTVFKPLNHTYKLTKQ